MGRGKHGLVRGSHRRRSLVVLTVLAMLAALLVAVPVTAAPPGNPFVGSWETTADNPAGEEHIRIQIGGGGNIHIRTDLGGICFTGYGQKVPLSAFGWGSVINDSPYVWVGDGDAFCHLRDGQGRQLVAPFNVWYRYDPATDTLHNDGDVRGGLGRTRWCVTLHRSNLGSIVGSNVDN